MTRPVPLAIISFLFGVFLVTMIVAPHFYTIEDAVHRSPEYARQVRLEAAIEGEPAEQSVGSTDSAPVGPRLVLRLQNTGELTVWGKVECRVSGFSAPIIVPIPVLPPKMESPAVYTISLTGAPEPEGEAGWQVRARWAKLYVK